MSAGQLDLRVSLDDRDEYVVSTRLIDHNTWDTTRARHKWPTAADAPLTWLGFLVWSASRRTGAIEPSVTWEQFLASCAGIENVTEDESAADPIRPGPGPG